MGEGCHGGTSPDSPSRFVLAPAWIRLTLTPGFARFDAPQNAAFHTLRCSNSTTCEPTAPLFIGDGRSQCQIQDGSIAVP